MLSLSNTKEEGDYLCTKLPWVHWQTKLKFQLKVAIEERANFCTSIRKVHAEIQSAKEIECILPKIEYVRGTERWSGHWHSKNTIEMKSNEIECKFC